jgi:ABC-type hemin transport system ATPase subunit
LEAVRGLSFMVAPGEVFGLLGPNGAGKTTTVEILEGYRTRSGGEVRVLGHDPARGERALRERIGIVLQSCGVEGTLTVGELLELGGDGGGIEDFAIARALIVRGQHGAIGIAKGARRVTGGARRQTFRATAARMKAIPIFALERDKYFLVDALYTAS